MYNNDLIKMTKEIVVAMASTSNQYHANAESAEQLVKAMDIIYNKLVQLSKKSKVIYPDNQQG